MTVAGWVVLTAADRDRKRQADELYERYARPVEAEHRGQYVAISSEGRTVFAGTVHDALDKAVEAFGPGAFVFKVGEKTVWHLAVTQPLVSSHFPYLPLHVELRQSESQIEALLDTGFDGDLAVPRQFVAGDDQQRPQAKGCRRHR